MISVVFTEQFYYPEGWGGAQLPRDITMHLAGRGMRVEVICGRDMYAPLQPGDITEDPQAIGVVIRRTPRFFSGRIHTLKLLKQVLFYLSCIPLLMRCARPTLYVTQTNPPLLVPIVAAAAALRRRPFMIIAQDIYPEVLFAHGMSRSETFAGRALIRLFRWAYRRATKVVALGPVMAHRLMEKGVAADSIEIISNWATGSETTLRGAANVLRPKWELQDYFVILYSGNLGIAHDVETPIKALRLLLASRPKVRLVFVGQGSQLQKARDVAVAEGVSHAVQFHHFVSTSELPYSLGLADIALVTLRPGFEGLVVPSKLLGYMARSIPTVYVGPYSDVEQMLTESGGGFGVRNDEVETLAQRIQETIDDPARRDEMGSAAKAYYEQHFTRHIGLEKYAQLVESLSSR